MSDSESEEKEEKIWIRFYAGKKEFKKLEMRRITENEILEICRKHYQKAKKKADNYKVITADKNKVQQLYSLPSERLLRGTE